MTSVTIIDTETKREENIKLPQIEDVFTYLRKPPNIVKTEIYNSFPEGYTKSTEFGAKPFASGGQLLIDDKGNRYSRDIYVRWDYTGHDNTSPHVNLNLLTRDHQTGRSSEIELAKCHFIEIGELPKTIFITIVDAGKSVIQPIAFLPKQEDKNYHEKEREFFRKVKERRLTQDDESQFKKEFDTYAESLQKRKKSKASESNQSVVSE